MSIVHFSRHIPSHTNFKPLYHKIFFHSNNIIRDEGKFFVVQFSFLQIYAKITQ